MLTIYNNIEESHLWIFFFICKHFSSLKQYHILERHIRDFYLSIWISNIIHDSLHTMKTFQISKNKQGQIASKISKANCRLLFDKSDYQLIPLSIPIGITR